MSDRGAKCRAVLCLAIVLAAMATMGIHAAWLHLGPHDRIRDRLARNKRVEKKILASRGAIHDCKGQANILALDRDVKDVCADPAEIVKSNMVEYVASSLARTLEEPFTDIAARLRANEDKRFVYIQRFVRDDRVRKIERTHLPGVFFQDASAREYPHKSFMCHVLGFVNHEGVGSAGVEQQMDRYLRGSPGLLETRVNGLRQELYSQRASYIPPLEGAAARLTIDQNIQYIVEKEIEAVVEEWRPKGAWAIIERVRTGEILAMASRPAYDLNNFQSAGPGEVLNRAIGLVYEPGSTFKVIAIAAALNEGVVTPDTVFDCENGAWAHNKKVLRDVHPYGNLTVADGVKKSSNILTAKTALLLGSKRQYEYMKAFGIGKKMGVDLPGEENGILHPVSEWSNISSTRIAIGQGVAVTALQMLGVFCAIANDGFMMKPYVISDATDRNGAVVFQTKPEVMARPLSYETAATMRFLLSRVTEEGGTGTRARVEGYDVAGKTGTAQKPEDGGYSDTANVASFVGFLPADDPEIALIVVVDEPQPTHPGGTVYGGTVAGPVFGRIAGQTVRYLDIQPSGFKLVGANREREELVSEHRR